LRAKGKDERAKGKDERAKGKGQRFFYELISILSE
jgi:hypothetical protein